jgi:hypothetical protein
MALVMLAIQVAPLPLRGAAWPEFEARPGPWPSGSNHFSTVALPKGVGAPVLPELAASWPARSNLTVVGVPFDLPTGPEQMLATRKEAEEQIAVALPADAREVLFLLAADFPDQERSVGGPRPIALEVLNEPERMTIELVYADGVSDQMLPVHAARASHGVRHGVALYAVHPAPGRQATRWVLHDRLRNSAFGLVALTVNTGSPLVKEPALPLVWYPPVKKAASSPARLVFNTQAGLTWNSIVSEMLGGKVEFTDAPVFTLKLRPPGKGGEARDIPSSRWKVERASQENGFCEATLSYSEGPLALRATFAARPLQPNETELTLKLVNAGTNPVIGTLFFPTLSGLNLGVWEDTWYFASRVGGVINRVPVQFRDRIGHMHPLQVDGFFSPKLGAGFALLPRDLEDAHRWYHVGKDTNGCSYALEFMPRTVAPGGAWESVPVIVAAMAGDWKDQFAAYRDWVKTWYRPQVPRQRWFQGVFSFLCACPIGRADFMRDVTNTRDKLGAADYVHNFGWALQERYGHWGDYNHFHQFGTDDADGKQRFLEVIRRAQNSGVPVGLYLDGYLISPNSINPPKPQRSAWAIRAEDGRLGDYYDGCYSMCPYVADWRANLTAIYQRVAADLKPDGLYIDEFGGNLPGRDCWATNHGHAVPMGMSPGERILTRQIRAAIPTNLVLYSELAPSDVACQFQDGAFSYLYPVANLGNEDWWQNQRFAEQSHERFAPHYVNLQRFAFPDFKTFHIIYDAPEENGNWSLLKYPFFNAEGQYHKGETVPDSCDAHALAFYRKIFQLQHQYRAAFTSLDVEPLVRTESPNLFANRFSAPGQTVWTLLNASYRTLRGPLLTVPHQDGAAYRDAWNDRPLEARVRNEQAELSFEIGPRSVGCIVRQQ